jgi:hypothetical protein
MGDGSHGREEFDDPTGRRHDEIEGLFDELVVNDDCTSAKLVARIAARRRRRASARTVIMATIISILALAAAQLVRQRPQSRQTGGERDPRPPARGAVTSPHRVAGAPRRRRKTQRRASKTTPDVARAARAVAAPPSAAEVARPPNGPVSGDSRSPTLRPTPSKSAREFGFER